MDAKELNGIVVHGVLYESAKNSLAELVRVDEVKSIRDKAIALQEYARRALDHTMELNACKHRLLCERRVGELLAETVEVGANQWVSTADDTHRIPTGISRNQSSQWQRLAGIPEHEFGEIYESIKEPIGTKASLFSVLAKRRENEAKTVLQADPPVLPEGFYHGDFRDFAELLTDDSIELIFTDPPYDRKSIPLYNDLASIAARVLRPGGSLITYCGQIQIPELINLMACHLRFWWINACVYSGQPNQMHKYGIKNNWKPLLWFVKGFRGDIQTFVSDAVSGGKEKTYHPWQQAQSEAEYYIERLCSQNGIVWDPFSGSGTTLFACKQLGKKWIGCEIDVGSIDLINQRLAL